jgi:peptide/nickel transport system permease protein
LWNGVLVLFGVVSVVFLIFNLKPGDPARMLADQRGSEEALVNIRKDLGLDLSLSERYLLYLNDLSPLSFHSVGPEDSSSQFENGRYLPVLFLKIGDFGIAVKKPYLRRSYRSRRDVSDILAEAFFTTAVLAVSAILFALVIGIALGTWAALRKGSPVDTLILGVSAIGMSGPSFFMAVVISWIGGFLWFERIPVPTVLIISILFGLMLGLMTDRLKVSWYGKKLRLFRGPVNGIFVGLIIGCCLMLVARIFGIGFLHHSFSLPGTGLPTGGSLVDLDPFNGPVFRPQHLILPALTLGIRPLSVVVQLTRSSLLEVLNQDHVRTARAKGLSERRIIINHGLRNALIPVVTTISGWLASLLAGAVFVEFIFGWKGLGLEVFNALENEDFPVVMGAVLLFSTIFVIMNLLVDLTYGVLDPRVRTR